MRKKIKTALDVFMHSGFRGLGQVIAQKCLLSEQYENLENDSPVMVPAESGLRFSYAACDDLIRLMAQYPEYCFPGRNSNHSQQWGLKQMGTLFCADKIHMYAPERILEVGAGFNTFFEETFGDKHEYWMLDDTTGLCDEKKFIRAIEDRQNTKFVKGLLGSFHPAIPDNYFDLVFSISALEHVPLNKRAAVYEDMYRVLTPGGVIVHSIDMTRERSWPEEEHEYMRNAGFIVSQNPDLVIRVRHEDGPSTLFEPMDIVFRAYYGIDRSDMWTNLRSVSAHVPTILVVARKPSEA